LKKAAQKLFRIKPVALEMARLKEQSFFATFCSQKVALSL
jgi:hypothetical protein